MIGSAMNLGGGGICMTAEIQPAYEQVRLVRREPRSTAHLFKPDHTGVSTPVQLALQNATEPEIRWVVAHYFCCRSGLRSALEPLGLPINYDDGYTSDL
jgi:hypothetical protein